VILLYVFGVAIVGAAISFVIFVVCRDRKLAVAQEAAWREIQAARAERERKERERAARAAASSNDAGALRLSVALWCIATGIALHFITTACTGGGWPW
jgi:hypothetical protein